MLDQLEDPHSRLSELWDKQHDDHVGRQLLKRVKSRFDRQTWRAFSMVALKGMAPKQVAAELKISVNSVFIAKCRVLRELRHEATACSLIKEFL